jgi:predicted phage tail protein
MRKIQVYGRLAKFLKRRVFHADVANAAEAVRFLLANFPKLEPELAQGHYRISVGDYDLAEAELHDPAGQQQIKIIPVVSGTGGAAGRIIAGVAIIALSFGIGAIASAGVTLGGLAGIGTVGTIGVGIGVSLVLGGVSQLLTPVPTINPAAGGSFKDTDKDPRKSYSFSGVQQTSRQGVPVPIVYGETLVGSVVISAGVDTVAI